MFYCITIGVGYWLSNYISSFSDLELRTVSKTDLNLF